MEKKLFSIIKYTSLTVVVVLGLFSIIGSNNSGHGGGTTYNSLQEGVYEITYTPTGGIPYTETFYLKQVGDTISGMFCGFLADMMSATSVYGYASGNDAVISGLGAGFQNYDNTQSIETTENLFYFWIENFDFMNPGATTDFGPVAYDGKSISFHNSFLGCSTKTYFNGCDFPLHIYGGSITVDTLVPNITGTYTGTALYTSHYNPSSPPLPDLLTGTVSGTFNVPFDGSPGTFTSTGTIDGMTMSADVSNAFFAPYYTSNVTIDSNGLFAGTYDMPWDNEQGTLTSTFVSTGTGCP